MAKHKTDWKRFVVPTVVMLAVVGFVLMFGQKDETTEPEQPEYDQSTATYLQVAKQLVPGFADDPNKDVIGVGKEVCRWYDDGSQTSDLVAVLTDAIPRKEAHTLINVSVEAFCPEYKSEAKGGK